LGFAFYIIGEVDEETGEPTQIHHKTVNHTLIDEVKNELDARYTFCEDHDECSIGDYILVDEAQDLYTSYGQSGHYKLKSNDYVGCLGLGSKSPFCYSNVFQVISYYDGWKYSYNCNKDIYGIPSIARVSQPIPTDRCNGLEVIVPVRTYDIYTFQGVIKDLYRYFDVPPNLFGGGLTIPTTEYIMKSEDGRWGIRKDSNGARAIMGNLSYPIVVNQQWETTTKQRKALNCPVDIFVPIGYLGITGSREDLSYDRKTVGRIINEAQKIIDECTDIALKEIKSQTNLWDARVKARSLSSFGYSGKIPVKIDSFTWNNIEVLDIHGVTFKDDEEFTIFKFERFGRKGKKKECVSVVPKSLNSFCEVDTNDFVERCTDNNIEYAIKFSSEAGRKSFFSKTGIVGELKKTSSMPAPVKYFGRSRRSRGRSTAKIYKFKYNGYNSTHVDWWKEEKYTVGSTVDKKLYVVLDRYSCYNSDDVIIRPEYFHNWTIQPLKSAGLLEDGIFGVRKHSLKTIQNDSSFVLLWDFIKNNKEKFIKRGRELYIASNINWCNSKFLYLADHCDKIVGGSGKLQTYLKHIVSGLLICVSNFGKTR
jgi:hypothetical protein